jgi:hypothetical protein
MKLYASFFVGLLVGMGSLSSAKAVVILNDNFDTYADTAAFQAVWPAVGSQASGTITQVTSVSSPNAVQIFSPAPSGVADQRNERVFTGGAVMAQNAQYIWSFDFYDTDGAAAAYRQVSNLQDTTAPTLTNQLVSMPLNNNQQTADSGGSFYMARILGYIPNATDPDGGPGDTANGAPITGAGQFFKLNDFATGVGIGPAARSTGWHNFKVIISSDDGLSQDYAFYVDNVLAEKVSNVGTAASLRKYDVVRIGPGISSTTDTVAFDNEHVEYIPFVATNSADFNGDHVIDAQDYALWRKYNPLASGATQATGDANGDGKNDGLDYTAWRATFGNAVGSGAGLSGSNVPEPGSFVLLLSSLGFVFAGRRRTR